MDLIKALDEKEACAIPWVRCVREGTSPFCISDGVKMKCTNNNCPLIGGLTYVHVECFERLQEELVAIVAKTGTKCKLWVVSTEVKLGPGQDWSRQQRRNFLWNWRGLKLVHKYLRCRCGKGLTMLDRDAWEISKARRKEEGQKPTALQQTKRCRNRSGTE